MNAQMQAPLTASDDPQKPTPCPDKEKRGLKAKAKTHARLYAAGLRGIAVAPIIQPARSFF
jgi:hypothetical protein